MQFFAIATFISLACGAIAAPAPDNVLEPSQLQARTCGTLTGKPLELCQGACKAACSVIPPSLAKTACQKSCTLGPLKARDVTLETEPAHLQARTCGTLTGKPLELCQGACKAACSVIPPSLAKKACQKSCTLGPLKAREADADEALEVDADQALEAVDFDAFGSLQGDDEASALQTREPLSGAQVCKAACAVTCNSTVLALRQKWCLEKCNGKCPQE